MAWAERVIRHEVGRVQARELHLVTIDGWFGQRWLGFSHKELGALGMTFKQLRVPPFVPSLHRRQYLPGEGPAGPVN